MCGSGGLTDGLFFWLSRARLKMKVETRDFILLRLIGNICFKNKVRVGCESGGGERHET